MDTLRAIAMKRANAGKEEMVFDWENAARLIAERKPRIAEAGLRGDWEWTGGTIWSDGKPNTDDYTYLASVWAVPELRLDGETIPCFRMASEVPAWDSGTKWPPVALSITHHLTQGGETQ